jgi:hypothetical protein
MEVKHNEFKIWHDPLEHEAGRECAIDHWARELAGHSKALHRVGFIDEDELREMLEHADAAYAHAFDDFNACDGNLATASL